MMEMDKAIARNDNGNSDRDENMFHAKDNARFDFQQCV